MSLFLTANQEGKFIRQQHETSDEPKCVDASTPSHYFRIHSYSIALPKLPNIYPLTQMTCYVVVIIKDGLGWLGIGARVSS